MSDPTFDYIVIGGGTAGALMCKRLTEGPSHSTLLVEAGGRDVHPWIHIPVGYLYCIGNPRTDWMFNTEPDPGLNGRTLRYPRGKTLGGCSSINGMIYMRGQARDYDQWARLTGDDAWGWNKVLQAFKRHEDHFDGPDDLHGSGGEWRVEPQRLRWDILDAFAEAAVQAGVPRTPDFNRGDNEGVGYFQVNQRGGWRWNTAKAFLRPACSQRANFALWTRTRANRLLFEPGPDGLPRCVGVELWNGRELLTARARREVILCAGAIGSPQLLQLSGVGPAGLLQAHGIPVVADLPGVGQNLQDHLQIRAVYKIRGASTLNVLASSWIGKVRIGLEYALWRSGPMSMAPSQLGAFTRSSAEQAWPNLQYHVQPLSLDAFGEPLHRFPAFTASVCNLNPTSRGTVRIRSRRPEDAPAIAPNYLGTVEDRRVAAESLRVTRRIVAQPALARYQPQEWKPGLQYQSDDELARLAGDIATTIFHPVGTTKMGADDDPLAVLDARLRVRGVRGLRVVDAGAMPTITSGNTNSPTLMMAEMAAVWVRAAAAS
ncbi:GMC family oxidoreductase [Variovorax saccharolyticus]|uniref:GMC family oxidoreductase n=1 Tax=Variovorax saccharolyticus TaxID=3053516 RepID=UPI0025788839|nr:GMC family oxidoreductase N-terminal domain-containing protein [Variovorax sp. J31P216]MDM0026542.1 GMC family oxidoreductase N-terminal domain-containing protein [Variovorax sp. J31P216]